MTLSSLLRRITKILDEGSVPYMLTGSLAAAYYATPRATQDIDVGAKLEWAKKGGSELQLGDVQAILRSQLERLDRTYIEHWVHELGLTELWNRAQQDVSS